MVPHQFRARKVWQALHFLDTTGGAQGVVPLCGAGSQSVAGVALSRHQKGVRRGWSPISASGSQIVAGVARSRHHRGCAGAGPPYPLRARKVWQALQFLDTTGANDNARRLCLVQHDMTTQDLK